jgi:hypothetical protein
MILFYIGFGFLAGFLCNLYLVIFINKNIIGNKKSIANCLYCKNAIK